MFEFIDVKFKEILNIPKLRIEKEKITSLIGPSGSGKTTILKMLNKMLSPTVGHILFNGQSLDQINSVDHRRHVTMLSQAPVMFDGDIKENLVAGLKYQKREIPDDNVLADMLVKVKLNKELSSPTQTLSGGEKQRLALGRVLLLNSEIYLLDEPSSALDETTAEAVIEMIAEYARSENKTLVMVTHSKAIAQRFSDEIIEVCNGQCSGRRQI
jgi:putative ABC transport system ATP-binding protein